MILLLLLTVGVSAQSTRLEVGQSISGEVSGEQSRAYSVEVKSDQYLRLVVTQSVGNPLFELYSPDGKRILEVDSRDFPNKSARITAVAGASGEYRISVRRAGRYEINLEELRPAGSKDRRQVEADRLLLQGLGEARKYAFDQAILSYEGAIGLYRELQDRERQAFALSAEASAYSGLSENAKAIDHLEQAIEILRELGDRRGEGMALKSIGNAYLGLSQYEKAIDYQGQALAIFRDVKDRNSEGRALANLGSAYRELGQYEKATGYYEEALAISREVKDRQFEGLVLYGLGGAYMNLRQNQKAIGYDEQALAIALEIKNHLMQGRALNGLGWSHTLLGQYKDAIGYYERALTIEREARDRTGEGTTLINMGATYADLGDFQKSIDYYGQALSLSRETKYRWGEAKALENLGWSSLNLKQPEKAIEYSLQALVIEREIKDREGEGETLNVLGNSYRSLSQNEKAIGYQEKALVVSREIKDRLGEARAVKNLGKDYQNLVQLPKAILHYEQALSISREIKDWSTETEELSGLMETWNASGKSRLAIFYGKQAVNTLQSMRTGIRDLNQDLQRSFLKDNEKPYHTLAEILIAQGRLAEAEQVLALLKEEEYFQYIRRDASEANSLNRRANLTPEEAEYEQRYREIGNQLTTIGVERGELRAKKILTPEESQRLDKLEHDLTIGNKTFEHFLVDLTQHFSAKPEITNRIRDLREMQGIMEDLKDLPAGTVAIFTLIGEDKFYAILRTPDAQKAYEYPIKSADLNARIGEFRQVLLDPKTDPRPRAQELYKILISGMADDLRQAKAKTLMWSLDGALRYLPLAALYDGKQYLIEQYSISVMTLASHARLKDRPDQEWKAAGFGVTGSHEGATALPSVFSELAGIITTNPGDGGILAGEIKLDGQFTQPAMRQMLRKHYQVVHIASHFRFQPGDDAQSYLMLGDGGHLSMAELRTSANLFEGVQLLTLSACNTGVGDGKEVEGFGTLAQTQGAKAVIASLWPVADESTSLLMREFYRIREISPGITKLEALREAQLELLQGKVTSESVSFRRRSLVHETPEPAAPQEFRHPFFWAPFFLMGNWL